MKGYNGKWVTLIFSLLLLISFFISWVVWKDMAIAGYDMPSGRFFQVSEKNFHLANPMPGLAPLFNAFWLIPVAALITGLLALFNKKAGLPAGVAGFLALSLATVYALFTSTLTDLGIGKSLINALQIGWYLAIVGAAGIILTGIFRRILLKVLLIIAGPLLTWAGFYFITKSVENNEFDNTKNVTTAYTVNATDLIREFTASDSAANAKYREKIITVNGRATATEALNDSTFNIKIEDSAGSYLIFSFVDDAVKDAKDIKPGDAISVKGSCSGGIYSDILSTEAVSFKRCVINKIK